MVQPLDTMSPRHAEAEAAYHPRRRLHPSQSQDQKHDSQREAIARWLEGNGIDPDKVAWYPDIESGRTMKRPEFDRLRAAIFAGTVQTVVVSKVDRIARRLRAGLDVLCDWCERGVRFVSITQQ